MPSYYTYLVSSLPMLHFGEKPPLSFKQFLDICKDLTPDTEIQLLKRIGQNDQALYESSRR
jgi:hypothetical protein